MHRTIKLPNVAVLIATIQLSGIVFAQPTSTFAASKMAATESRPLSVKASATSSNPLAAGAEIFENLTEAAPTIDAAAVENALTKFEALYPAIAQRLSAEQKKHLDSLVMGVRTTWQKSDRGAMAIHSIEAYRLLQVSIGHNGQPVPVEVPLLDYAGFKLDALLLSARPDWKQARTTANEAKDWWAVIGSRITDKPLRDAMAHTIAGIQDAVARQDPELLHFAAQMDLILVDSLEAFFSAHPSG